MRKCLPNEDLFIHLKLISAFNSRYFCSYLTRFCLLYSYCFHHFCLLLDHRMGMINVSIVDTVPMPIKVVTRHDFCDFPVWKCSKQHKLLVDSLLLSVSFCRKNVECVRNSGVSSKICVKWVSNSGSFCENRESWQPWICCLLRSINSQCSENINTELCEL